MRRKSKQKAFSDFLHTKKNCSHMRNYFRKDDSCRLDGIGRCLLLLLGRSDGEPGIGVLA